MFMDVYLRPGNEIATSFFLSTVDGQDNVCPIDFLMHGQSCYHIFAEPKLSWWDAMVRIATLGLLASGGVGGHIVPLRISGLSRGLNTNK